MNPAVQLLVGTAVLAVRTAEQGTPSNLLAIAGEYCCAGMYCGAGSVFTYLRRSLFGPAPLLVCPIAGEYFLQGLRPIRQLVDMLQSI